MSDKMYIRVKADGFIYDFNEIMAKNPDCEVVTEEVAYPERFGKPVAAPEVVKTPTKRKSASGLSVGTPSPDPVGVDRDALNREASKGLV